MRPLPAPLLERARRARKIVEVGAGRRFETALALREAAPDAEVWVTDVEPDVLLAPPTLHARLLDAHGRVPDELAGADLVVAIRLPEELQLATARLARELSADLAIRPLKDEWADVSSVYRRHVVWPDGWRYHAL